MNTDKPIAAVSTPYGRGGIAVIRMSGEGVLSIADRFFHPTKGRTLADTEGNRTVYGHIFHQGSRIDDGIAAVFRAPHSYTGEDTVEISCHGGIVLAGTVLSAAIAAGCRPADAGEFTKRAFLNGKISLSQAEAVMGLIDAASEEGLKLASAQARGVLADKIDGLKRRLTELLASVYAYADYPDEDLTELTTEELSEELSALLAEMKALRATYGIGKAVCEGILTVISGKPNTGKSSLLNRILGRSRAIVTDVAGTTRDTVEERVELGGVLLRLCDTAGLRETEDVVERLGVGRSRELLEQAELVLAVFDSSAPFDEEDRAFLSSLRSSKAAIIPILNKCDLPDVCDFGELRQLGEPLRFSAKTGEGLEALRQRISSLFISERIDYDTTPVIANARQNAALTAACESVESAARALSDGFPQDVAGLDLELALQRMGDLDGRSVSAEITDCIFSRFCVGK